MLRHCIKCHNISTSRVTSLQKCMRESRLMGRLWDQQLRVSALHTSPVLLVGKAKNTKKKLVKKVKFKKSIKTSWDVVTIHSNMTVAEVARALQKDVDHVFEVLLYIPNTDDYDRPNSVIKDITVIKQILDKSGYRWKVEEKKEEIIKKNKDAIKRPPPDPSSLVKRPPVVTIMGHVDHGKTTLLDALRNSNRVAQEFGGITQHIGAFSVTLPQGETITFLDTPGHAAFSAMRARGARVTDIIVLVVAADDGVMKQTQESIQHAQHSQVPLVVAINKIDRREANIERTKDLLLQNGVMLEEHGGDVLVVPISALKGTNLVSLQETIVALAELMEIKADPSGPVEGSVIEANKHAGKGKVATVIIQRGVLRKGSCLVAGTAWAKVRNMFDDRGLTVKEAGPGVAVEVSGWKELPSAGDEVLEVESESRAGEVVLWRANELKTLRAMEDLDVIEQKHEAHQKEYESLRKIRLDLGKRRGSIYKKIRTKETIESSDSPELSIVVKGDVDGSVDAILDVINSYDCNRCQMSVLQYGVGDVTEHDIDMASSFNGHIIAFNVGIPKKISQLAAEKNVEIYSHNVIYKMVDHLKELLNERIPLSDVEEVIGEADVLQTFTVKESRQKVPVAGCRCLKGTLNKSKHFKLVRSGQIIFEGPAASLRHFKEEVSSIAESEECGLILKDITDEPQPGDKIFCYDIQQRKLEVEWNLEF